MIIYRATNKVNGKIYIGQTIYDLESRKKTHKTGKFLTKFKNALNKYDIDGFDWDVLCECDTQDELNEKENHYIELYDTVNIGYNLMSGGGQNGRHCEETKQKIREAVTGEKNPFHGKKHTEETKRLIGELAKGSKSSRSRQYIVTTPEGEEIHVDGLREFCREHGLTRELMGAVARGIQKHHKGYKCRYDD